MVDLKNKIKQLVGNLNAHVTKYYESRSLGQVCKSIISNLKEGASSCFLWTHLIPPS